jgi:hypothetical protein
VSVAQFFGRRPSSRPTRLAAALLALACAVVFAVAVPAAPAAAAGPPYRAGTPLLLVHGYTDTCAAFTTDPGSDDPTDIATQDYLRGQYFTNVVAVGYYNPSYDVVGPGQCGANPRADTSGTAFDGIQHCPQQPALDGKVFDDGLMYLSCVFAWYVYANYTQYNKPVNILAHSMGGLVVRGAIAFSGGQHLAGFPAVELAVNRVVTVATPHGGLSGYIAALYQNAEQSVEVFDMTVCPGWEASCQIDLSLFKFSVAYHMGTSSFMSQLRARGTPRGANHAYWALVGASDSCRPNVADTALSCLNFLSTVGDVGGDPYFSMDGVVPAASQLDMPADFKILYGSVDHATGNVLNPVEQFDSGGIQYRHEAGTCEHVHNANIDGVPLPIPVPLPDPWFAVIVPPYVCLTAPFYLNDNSIATTNAWVCAGNCPTGIGDVNVAGAATPQRRSLAEIVHLFVDPLTHVNTGAVTSRQPGLAAFHNGPSQLLYVCWVDDGGRIHVDYSSDGVTFNGHIALNETSFAGCTLTSDASRLYLAWPGTDANHRLNVRSSTDGVTFPEAGKMTLSDTSRATPAVAAVGGALYLVWTGSGSGEQHLYATVWVNGAWKPTTMLPDTTDSASSPALSRHNGSNIMLAWQAYDWHHAIWIASFTPQGFPSYSYVQSHPYEQFGAGPTLAAWGGTLVAGWKGNVTNDTINTMTYRENTQPGSFQALETPAGLVESPTCRDENRDCKMGRADTTRTTFAMAEFAGDLYLAWSGTDSPAHLYIARGY